MTGAGCALTPFIMPVTPPSGTVGGGAQGVRAYLATLRTYMEHAATAALATMPGAEVVLTNAISPYGHDIAEHLGPHPPRRSYSPRIPAGPTRR